MAMTRRQLLQRIGRAGGYSAAFLAMQGLGLMDAQASEAGPIAAEPGSGRGLKVVILGGGMAGLVAAYELRALGYTCTVLEARERPGGRNWTVRRGDKIAFNDGTTQLCEWGPGQYQNFGPARLPSVHKTILGYCKRLSVELEVEVNMTRSSLMQNDNANNGKPEVLRQVENDTRGHVSELLEKCLQRGTLDQELTKDDRDRMLAFLEIYGPLDNAGKYNGSERAGFSKLPGAGPDVGVLSQPIDMHTLLDEDFWRPMLFDEVFDMQATMFQPKGGMDRIPFAFAKSLGKIVQYGAQVSAIRKTPKGVRVEYASHGAAQALEADYCICALPLSILKKISNDLSAAQQRVISDCVYSGWYKIAWESRRFWEQDYNIFGGLEFVRQGCAPIWFPSHGMFSERGVFVSGYADEFKPPFGPNTTLEEKFAESRKTVERLHPGHSKEMEKPLLMSWKRVPFNEGSWVRTFIADPPPPPPQPGVPAKLLSPFATPAESQVKTLPGYELLEGDGPIFLAGDHMSHLVAWQEGAALSAHRAVQKIAEMAKASRLAQAK